MLSKVNVVLRKAPGAESSTLGIRAAWAMLTEGGLDVQLICLGDGVFNLGRVPGYIGGMLDRFMAEQGTVYARAGSLAERGIAAEALAEGVTVAEDEEIAEMVADADATTAY